MIEASADGSDLEMAVSVTYGGLGIAVGAWYESEVISPQAAPEQPKPLILHSTPFSLSTVPVTTALTGLDAPSGTRTPLGAEIRIAIPDSVFAGEEVSCGYSSHFLFGESLLSGL